MKAVFVAGTDTDVGKTVVTGLLGRYLLESGASVVTQKWIQTGNSGFSKDVRSHLKLMRRREKDFSKFSSSMAPYQFRFPSSPHLASRIEKRAIMAGRIKKSFRRLSANFDFVIVEGTGGLLVPINRNKVLVDIVKELDLSVLLVAGNRLGAINHVLLSLEALRTRGIRTIGVIFNNRLKSSAERRILKDNPAIVKSISGVEVFGNLPHSDDMDALYGRFKPLGNKMAAKLWKT